MSRFKEVLKLLNGRIFGLREAFSMEHRFFSMTTFYGMLLCLLAIFVNYFSNVDILVQAVTALSFAVFLVLYALSRFKPDHKIRVWIFVIASIVMLSAAWFFNGGHNGSIAFLFFFVFIISLMITKKSSRPLILLLYLTVLSALYFIHFYWPGLIIGYKTPVDRFVDVYFTNFYCMFLLYGIVVYILNNYTNEKVRADNERIKAENANLELTGKNDRIQIQNIELEQLNSELAEKNHQILRQNDRLEELIEQLTEKNEYISLKMFELNTLNNQLVRINSQLDKLNQDLTEANSTKNRFFSLLSHDLKNPLGAVRNYAELFRYVDKMTIDEIHEIALSMEKSVSFVLELLDNVLLWSLSQTNRLEFLPSTIDCRSFMNSQIASFESVASIKNISLSCHVDGNIQAFADSNMISTVLRNLLSNAIKFTSPGGIISVDVSNESMQLVKVTVSDSGIGISPEDIQKLFRIDVHHTTIGTKSEKGTGLGLILCKEFVDKNGGKIWVDSRPGIGSSFNFTLPKTAADNN